MIYILIGVAALLVVLLIIIAMQPADFRITRSAQIAAPPDVVFAQVNDLHKWEEWSPWAKLDPQARKTYDGPPAGKGAKFAWAGNKKIGEGRMTIIDSRPSELVKIDLEFLKPFAARNVAEFTFAANRDRTNVEWSMTGRRPFVAKAFCIFMNMDKMVGGDFEKGLAQMKAIAERR